MKKIIKRDGTIFGTTYGGMFIIIIVITSAWHLLARRWEFEMDIKLFFLFLLIDIIYGLILLEGLIYFFAQFVLPIQNSRDRKEIYKRVRAFASNDRGPAIFIKNGHIIEREGERDRKKPGVVVLDTASAAVIQTDIEYVDAVGPGVRFTKVIKIDDEEFNEYLAGSVDLRIQWKFIGPLANENPFNNPPLYPKNLTQYNAIWKRRQSTSGWTRDGFEVSPTIGIKFCVIKNNITKSESGVMSCYGYDPQNVWKAIVQEPTIIEKEKVAKHLMKWDELPAHLTVNLWREYIRKFKLEELFTSNNEVSKLQTIEEMMNSRVQKEYVDAFDEFGERIQGEVIESPEFKYLTNRGIKVLEIHIQNTVFETSLEQKLAEQWSGEWLKIEKRKEELLKKREVSREAITHKKAIKNFANLASTHFENTDCPNDMYTTLLSLIEPLKNAAAAEGRDNPEIKETLNILELVWKWLITNRINSSK